MTDQHKWPTAPIIQAVWVTPIFEETGLTGIWTRVKDGVYYSVFRGYVARKGEGYFTNVTEYWPRDYRKDEVQRLQRALTERNIVIAGLRKELEEQPASPFPDLVNVHAPPPSPDNAGDSVSTHQQTATTPAIPEQNIPNREPLKVLFLW